MNISGILTGILIYMLYGGDLKFSGPTTTICAGRGSNGTSGANSSGGSKGQSGVGTPTTPSTPANQISGGSSPATESQDIKVTTEGSTTENDTNKYDPSNPDKHTYICKFKDGAKCTKITYKDKEVWKHETTSSTTGGGTDTGGTTPTLSYPVSFIYKNNDNKFVLLFKDELHIYTLNTNGVKWEGGKTEGVDLDVSATSSADKFDYSSDSGKATFIPKAGFVFKAVKKGSDDVFSPTQKSQYVYKVILDSSNSNLKLVNLCLADGSKKSFKENTGSGS